ncbi:unnamed protein product, partial [Hymenolepis diminuta]
TTRFFNAIEEFDDVTLRTVITAYLAFNPRDPENTDHLSTEETRSPSDNYSTNIRSSHFQNADFVENVVTINTALWKTSLPEVQRKWSQRRLLARIFYE